MEEAANMEDRQAATATLLPALLHPLVVAMAIKVVESTSMTIQAMPHMKNPAGHLRLQAAHTWKMMAAFTS